MGEGDGCANMTRIQVPRTLEESGTAVCVCNLSVGTGTGGREGGVGTVKVGFLASQSSKSSEFQYS